MDVKQELGWWFPAHEAHLPDWMRKVNDTEGGRLAYQGKKRRYAVSLCKKRRRAIDVGAHVGLMSYYFASAFERVEAFEPVALHRECFVKNVPQGNVTLHPYALGDKTGSVSMHTAHSSSGDTTVAGAGDIPLKRLDDVFPDATDIDYLKLDVEGYELRALKGAEQLIKRCKPVICVEQKPGKGKQFGLPDTAAVDYLRSLGYKLQKEMSGDYIMAHGGCGCGERRQVIKQTAKKVVAAVGKLA